MKTPLLALGALLFAGTASAQSRFVSLSPDLIHWTNAPPGLYTNLPSHLFFRLRAERIP